LEREIIRGKTNKGILIEISGPIGIPQKKRNRKGYEGKRRECGGGKKEKAYTKLSFLIFISEYRLTKRQSPRRRRQQTSLTNSEYCPRARGNHATHKRKKNLKGSTELHQMREERKRRKKYKIQKDSIRNFEDGKKENERDLGKGGGKNKGGRIT